MAADTNRALAHVDEPTLLTGVIVGTAVISHVTNGGTPNGATAYHWHLADVRRFKRPRAVTRQPQPVWFRPF